MFSFLTAAVVPSVTALLSSLLLMWGMKQFNGKLFALSDDMMSGGFLALLVTSLIFCHLAWRNRQQPTTTAERSANAQRFQRMLIACTPMLIATGIGLAVVGFMVKVIGHPMTEVGHWFAWPWLVSAIAGYGAWAFFEAEHGK
ncbi:MAG: hypothetical protein WAX89_06145 [Alphaproteobacteria bacterium]